MTGQLILRQKDFFPHAHHPVAVADRYPQNEFAEHTHEFYELVLVWRGNGLHLLNDRPYRITRGDLFYIRAQDRHGYTSVNDLVLQNVIYRPDQLTLNMDWAGLIPGLGEGPYTPGWRLTGQGMAQARQIIGLIEQESAGKDKRGALMIQTLFAQLLVTLERHRFAP